MENTSELRQICVEGYSIYFGDHWNENGLEWYLNKQFGDEKLKSDLKDKNVDYYLIQAKGKPVGFIKVNNNSITNLSFEGGAELEKMYVLPKYKGLGIGKKALNEIMKITQKRGKKILFLDVLDTNKNAIAFYENLGFKFHSNTRLQLPYFKEELRGLNRMFIELQ
ncbi:MAG: GNAT family N-acetyltransferase [Aurantibacter sp.]